MNLQFTIDSVSSFRVLLTTSLERRFLQKLLHRYRQVSISPYLKSKFNSCCIATTETRLITSNMTPEQKLRAVYDPIVKEEMRESWEKNWKSWFCTTNEVEDIRWPGKLKGFLMLTYFT